MLLDFIMQPQGSLALSDDLPQLSSESLEEQSFWEATSCHCETVRAIVNKKRLKEMAIIICCGPNTTRANLFIATPTHYSLAS